MRYPTCEAFIANTDKAWFDYLCGRARGGYVDEVNFWSPRATRPMKQLGPGEPVFFRLKKPDYAIAGYGFFADFHVLELDEAWSLFGWKNGDPDKLRFLQRIGGYRRLDLLDPRVRRSQLGCTILREAHFWPPHRWIPWGDDMGWSRNIVQGRTDTDAARVGLLMDQLRLDAQAPPDEFAERFVPLDIDERDLVAADVVRREGQGAFRLRLLRAYEGRCAITGEHTELVLDAAHIQPYRGPRSNHVQNGLLLTKEFHALFDRGYAAVTPDLEVRISPRLRTEWKNGHRYYPYDGARLIQVPAAEPLRPSPEALEWHLKRVFRAA